MADNDFTHYTRSELLDEKRHCDSQLNLILIKPEPTEQKAKTNHLAMKTRLETQLTAIKDALKVKLEPTPAPPAPLGGPQVNDQAMVKAMKDTATVQNLLEVVRAITRLNVGDCIERFVSELDQIYKVEVQPQLGELASLEDEFVRAAKRLLTFSMYEQMDKSSTTTTTWTQLKKYLVDTHGSKITMFQHLNRLWKLELKPDEKLTDYGARLEEQVHKATLHIKKNFSKKHNGTDMTVDDFSKLIGAMLASLQVRKQHEDVFKSMIKGMDQHWTPSSLLADAQDYVDRLGSNNNATKTGAEVAFLSSSTKNTKSSNQKKSSAKSPSDESSKVFKELKKQLEDNQKAIQSLTLTNKSIQTGRRSKLSKSEMEKLYDAGKGKPIEDQICMQYLQHGKCYRRGRCPRKHVDNNKTYVTCHEDIKPEVQNESSDIDALFQ